MKALLSRVQLFGCTRLYSLAPVHAPSQLQQLGGGGERDMHRILKNQKERKEVTPVEPSWPQLIPADPN